MDRIWDDMLFPEGALRYPSPDQWQQWRNEITTGVGGLAAGFRSEILLRGYKVIEEMSGNVSFIQAWVLSITGRLPTRDEDRLLNALFVNTAIADPRFWFNRTARFAATVKGSPAGCMAAGIATKDGTFFSAGPAYTTARFFKNSLDRIQTQGVSLEDIVREKIQKKEIITGYGRVLARGKDERNDVLISLAAELGLDKGPYMALAVEVEQLLQKLKSGDLHMNGGGLRTALLLDMKFEPHHVLVFNLIMHIIGLAGNITEAFEQPPGQFLPLTDEDIDYKGPGLRRPPAPSDRQHIVHTQLQHRIVVMDSVSYLEKANRGDVIVTGSHGGESAVRHSLGFFPRGLVVNDAGKGKNGAGIKGLGLMDEQACPGAAVSADSAMIGDGMDAYENGIVSAVNQTAQGMGVRLGMTAREASRLMLVR